MTVFSRETDQLLRDGDEVFLVTGSGGWLGRAMVEMLSASLGDQMADRTILCGSKRGLLKLKDGSTHPVHALADAASLLGVRPAIVCHFAFLTKDRVGQMSEHEFVEGNRVLSNQVGNIVALPGVHGVLLTSSGAVYDHFHAGKRDGAANLYGMLKAEDEARFARICEARAIPLVVPRVFNVSGPYINKFDTYALSSIILDVLRGGSVRIRANRAVYRSYMHVFDIHELGLRALLGAACRATPCTRVFDTRGTETLEVGELAVRVCRVLERTDLPIMRPEMVSQVNDSYLGDSEILAQILCEHGYKLIDLDRQISDTASYLADVVERL